MNQNQIGTFRLRSPWALFDEKLWAMFRKDGQVETDIDEKARKYVIRVETAKKADALSRLLPPEVTFGNVAFRICIVPANVGETLPPDAPLLDVLKAAFDGNNAIAEIRQVSKGLFRDLCYVVCENCVVQIPADNFADINGNISTLYEDIARELFTGATGALFCTTVRIGGGESNALDKPLGEWP